jgi:hypothetical protein
VCMVVESLLIASGPKNYIHILDSCSENHTLSGRELHGLSEHESRSFMYKFMIVGTDLACLFGPAPPVTWPPNGRFPAPCWHCDAGCDAWQTLHA